MDNPPQHPSKPEAKPTPVKPAPITSAYGPHKPPPGPKKPGFFSAKGGKFLRLIKYFLLSCIILTIIEIGLAYWLVSSRWHLLLSNEEMLEYASYVKQAEPMPENFMRVYTAIFPHHVNTTLTQQVFVNYGTRFLFRHTELDDKPHCMCDMIYDIQKKKHQELEDVEWDGRLQDLEFGFGIEKYATPEECFYYVMSYRVPELLNQLSSRQYGHLKNKAIAQMNDDELLELILLLKSRSRYSRHKNPAKFEKALAHYRERLQQHLEMANQ
jgi:hypothetical protein